MSEEMQEATPSTSPPGTEGETETPQEWAPPVGGTSGEPRELSDFEKMQHDRDQILAVCLAVLVLMEQQTAALQQELDRETKAWDAEKKIRKHSALGLDGIRKRLRFLQSEVRICGAMLALIDTMTEIIGWEQAMQAALPASEGDPHVSAPLYANFVLLFRAISPKLMEIAWRTTRAPAVQAIVEKPRTEVVQTVNAAMNRAFEAVSSLTATISTLLQYQEERDERIQPRSKEK